MTHTQSRYSIYAIATLITFACIFMVGPMRDGFLAEQLADRVGFMASNPGIWKLGWTLWMFSALGLLLFCTLLASAIENSPLKTFGLFAVALGIAPDLAAETLFAYVIPLASAQEVGLPTLAVLERTAVMLTSFLGNGLYNIGGLILTLLYVKQTRPPMWFSAWGIVAWILGLGLSIATAANLLLIIALFTGAAMVLSTTWMVLFARRQFA